MKTQLQSSLAPIALFTFNRPEHTLQMLESLKLNPEFSDSPLYIYCDGARNSQDEINVTKLRNLVKELPHQFKTIIERDENWGLANSIISGVSDLCERYGRAIVIEDDLILSPFFLDYMNTGLDKYLNDEQVMQISGHMFPVELSTKSDSIMLPITTSWGWATWNRAWKYFDPDMVGYEQLKANKVLKHQFNMGGGYPAFKMLTKQKFGKINSWAIRWYLSVFLREGLILFPSKTLVINDGFDGSGTHCKTVLKISEKMTSIQVKTFPEVEVNDEDYLKLKKYLKSQQVFLRKLSIHIRGFFSR